jgi:murein DD-endopeptidase MepM/ murein hydrolase activator NlpD
MTKANLIQAEPALPATPAAENLSKAIEQSVQRQPGEEVRRGERIGAVGSSGRSTGPHLHYEVHEGGEAVNPLYYILDAY